MITAGPGYKSTKHYNIQRLERLRNSYFLKNGRLNIAGEVIRPSSAWSITFFSSLMLKLSLTMRLTAASLLLFLLIPVFSFSQTGWFQRLNAGDHYLGTGDSLTGPKAIVEGADGDLFVLANRAFNNYQYIYKVDPSGSPIRWSVAVGVHGGLISTWGASIYATADSGCIIATNQFSIVSDMRVDGTISKYSKNGNLEWSDTFNGFSPDTTQWSNEASDALQLGQHYYARVGDTIVSYDLSHSTMQFFPTQILPKRELANGDILAEDGDGHLLRIDTSGQIVWSNTQTGTCSCLREFYYSFTGDSVVKTDLSDGSTVWVKRYPPIISSLSPTSDGGFLLSSGRIPEAIVSNGAGKIPGVLILADSSGAMRWLKSYDFPQCGLPIATMTRNGRIVTGGSYVHTDQFYAPASTYATFIASFDSSELSFLDSLTYSWPGDANANDTVGFMDDVLNIVLALGFSGRERDTLSALPFPGTGLSSDVAIDWVSEFANGVNHKHADTDGNGIVEMNDIVPLTLSPWLFPFSIGPWHRHAASPSFTSVAVLTFRSQNQVVAPGDSIRYFILAGKDTARIDSLYGLAFELKFDPSALVTAAGVDYWDSDFGDPASDLRTLSFADSNQFNEQQLWSAVFRIDRQNVYQLYDTIGELVISIDSALQQPGYFHFSVEDIRATTYAEFPVQFTAEVDSIYIDPSLITVNEANYPDFEVFPNPAEKSLHFKGMPFKQARLSIMTLDGKFVLEMEVNEVAGSIPLSKLDSGNYLLIIDGDYGVIYRKLIIN